MDNKIEYFKHLGTNEIIKIVDENDFPFFKENFVKNDNSFPYINPNDAKYIVAKVNGEYAAIIAYAYPQNMLEYRKNRNDEKHNDFAHIFDLDVKNKFEHKGLMSKMIIPVIEDCKRNGCKGVTIMAKTNGKGKNQNDNLAKTYARKFGFKYYNEDEKNANSPMMSLKF